MIGFTAANALRFPAVFSPARRGNAFLGISANALRFPAVFSLPCVFTDNTEKTEEFPIVCHGGADSRRLIRKDGFL